MLVGWDRPERSGIDCIQVSWQRRAAAGLRRAKRLDGGETARWYRSLVWRDAKLAARGREKWEMTEQCFVWCWFSIDGGRDDVVEKVMESKAWEFGERAGRQRSQSWRYFYTELRYEYGHEEMSKLISSISRFPGYFRFLTHSILSRT